MANTQWWGLVRVTGEGALQRTLGTIQAVDEADAALKARDLWGVGFYGVVPMSAPLYRDCRDVQGRADGEERCRAILWRIGREA